ncbi:DNA polymerase III subunit delta [Peptococcaceae bacterium]|nr:DNA polymerase III subunit delta [Peptococcaceae bacterium]
MCYYKNFIKNLKNGVIYPVYLFYGEEIYLKKQAIFQIKKLLFGKNNIDFNIMMFDGERAEIKDIIDTANSVPFMVDKKLIIVKNAYWFSNVKNAKVQADEVSMLINYIDNPNPTTCLIFDAGEEVDKRKKIFKAVSKAGQTINFEKLKSSELGEWLDLQLRINNKKIEPSARDLLINAASGLMWLANELDKLINYIGDSEIIYEDDVREVVYFPLEYHIFDVLDAIGERKYEKAILGIKSLIMNKEQPQVILAMIARQFRLMLLVQELMAKGFNISEIAREIKEKPYPVKKAAKLCKNFNQTQLINLLKQLAELDLDIKTGRQAFYTGIENLFLRNAVT